jgi:pimeloyl-ACP methyl ester carboxylesterase
MTVVHAGIFHYDGYGPGFGGDKITPALMEAHPNIWLNDHLKKTPEKKLWKKFLADFNKMWSQRAILSEDDLKRIVHPVLVIQGDRDLVKMEHAVRMHQLIRNSQLCILPSTTHFVLFENPPLIAKAVLDFFLRKGALRKMNR